MNAAHLKLGLALLWLVPGVGLIAFDAVTGETHGFPLLGHTVPLGWAFLAFGAVNLLRWYATRVARTSNATWDTLRQRSRKAVADAPPDANFRFDDPPSPP